MIGPVLSMLIGVALAWLGGELFVRGSVGIATAARIPAGIVGATVAAFATSSPELSVAIQAALNGVPEIAVGDVVGSNVVNVALILGVVALIKPLTAERRGIGRDLFPALLAPVVTAIFAADGDLVAWEAAILLAGFLVWLGISVSVAAKARKAADPVEGAKGARAWVEAGLGLAALVGAGTFIVTGAKGVGAMLGMDAFVVGATLVALGTSAPELATVLVAKLRGHDEVGLGTVLGSNLFNGLFILPVACLIHPARPALTELWIGLGVGLFALLACIPGRANLITRPRGALLLVAYVGYVVALLAQPG